MILFAGPDAQRAVDRRHPDLPVADSLGPGMLGDDVDDRLGVVIQYDEVQPDLRQEHGHVPAVWTGDSRSQPDEAAVLLSETPDIGHREPVNAVVDQGLGQFVELLRPDDGGDQFHGHSAFRLCCQILRPAKSIRRSAAHYMLRIRWNLRMSSLPANRAAPTRARHPAASAVPAMCFIAQAFLLLRAQLSAAGMVKPKSRSKLAPQL